jgi:hypothetical protein
MLLGGAPAGSSPAAAPAPSPTPRVVTMICGSPLYLWGHGMPLPDRSIAGGVSLGQQFTVLAGPLMTNRATSYIQIDVATIELDYPGDHYWILRDCALPTIR